MRAERLPGQAVLILRRMPQERRDGQTRAESSLPSWEATEGPVAGLPTLKGAPENRRRPFADRDIGTCRGTSATSQLLTRNSILLQGPRDLLSPASAPKLLLGSDCHRAPELSWPHRQNCRSLLASPDAKAGCGILEYFCETAGDLRPVIACGQRGSILLASPAQSGVAQELQNAGGKRGCVVGDEQVAAGGYVQAFCANRGGDHGFGHGHRFKNLEAR